MPIDMSLATKAPPRKNASGNNTRPSTSPKNAFVPEPTQTEKRAKGLMELGQLGQGICLMFGQYADAAAIGTHFQPIAIELANVAESADIIAKPIDMLIEIGPYGALLAACLPFALQIAANHHWVNADMLMGQGVIPPELLEAQMRANVARAQAEQMKARQMAMKEAQAAQAEFDTLMREAQAA